VAPLTDREPGITIDDAYRIQLRMIQRRLDAGETIIGKKIGVTSKVVMDMLKVNQPDFGQMTSGMVFNEGEAIDTSSMIAPKAEAEVAFMLKQRPDGPGRHRGRRAARHRLRGALLRDRRLAHPGLEDQDPGHRGRQRLLRRADPRRPPQSPRDIDLALAGMVLEKNGELISTSTGAAVQGSPVNAVAWLANTLGAWASASRPAR
jgi:2-oxopent-4-enoate/cis-2-oxohex-4-enoate hydratase